MTQRTAYFKMFKQNLVVSYAQILKTLFYMCFDFTFQLS